MLTEITVVARWGYAPCGSQGAANSPRTVEQSFGNRIRELAWSGGAVALVNASDEVVGVPGGLPCPVGHVKCRDRFADASPTLDVVAGVDASPET